MKLGPALALAAIAALVAWAVTATYYRERVEWLEREALKSRVHARECLDELARCP